LWRAYAYVRPYWRVVGGAYLAAFLIVGLNVAIPQVIRALF
jgi:hypothetical protein